MTKQTILTFLASTMFITLYAQSNIEIGTKWTYSIQDFQIEIPAEIDIVGDTIIGGVQWFVTDGVGGCASDFKDALIRESDDKVYMMDLEVGEEYLLYDYSKQAGESWDIQILGTNVIYTINVTSTGTMIIDGEEYNVQFIDKFDFGSYIIEGIGSNKYFFPQGNICDPPYRDIRCFSNSSIEVDFDPDHECDAIIVETATKSVDKDLSIQIFPNPSSDVLNITSNQENHLEQIDIHDIEGRVVKEVKPTSNSVIRIDISDLSQGVYYLKIRTGGVYQIRQFTKI